MSLFTDQYFTVKFNVEFKPPSQKIQIAKARRFKNSERRSAFHDHYCIDSCFICVKENEKRSFFQRMRSMPTKCCINPFNQTAKVKTTGSQFKTYVCLARALSLLVVFFFFQLSAWTLVARG